MNTDLDGRDVLIADRFWYFGGTRCELPERFWKLDFPNPRARRNHRTESLTDTELDTLIEWLDSHGSGVIGSPRDGVSQERGVYRAGSAGCAASDVRCVCVLGGPAEGAVDKRGSLIAAVLRVEIARSRMILGSTLHPRDRDRQPAPVRPARRLRALPLHDYRRAGASRKKTMTLTATEFIRRMLLHVLPPGFHRIRHYGFLANRNRRQKLTECRRLLCTPPPAAEAGPVATDYRDRYEVLTGRSLRRCPRCHDGNMQAVDHLAGAWGCPVILDSS